MTATGTTSASSVPAAVGRFVWNTTVGLVRDFAAQDLKDGIIRVRGFSAAMKVIVIVASVLLLTTIFAYASGDVLRTGQELLVPPGGAPGRGTLVPRPLVPITLALLAVGAALGLAGALHASRVMRVAVLGFYLMVALAIQGLAYSLRGGTGTSVPLGFVCIGGVVAVFVARWRAQPRPAAEFAVLLVLIAGGFALAQDSVVRADEFSGTAFAVNELGIIIGLLLSFTQPLLFVAGLDTIAFGAKTSGWLLQYLDRRIAQWAVFVGLAALTAWRARDLVREVIDRIDAGPTGDVLSEYGGAAAMIGLLWGYWWVLKRINPSAPGTAAGDDDVHTGSVRVRLPLGMVYAGIALLFVPLFLVIQNLAFFGVDSGWIVERVGSSTDILGKHSVIVTYRVIIGLTLVGLSILLTRRGRRGTLPLFLGVVGLSDLYGQLLTNVSFLRRFYWFDQGPVDLWWVVLFAGATIWWVLRRELTELRAERLFYLVLLTALIRQANFIGDPFGPLLGFAGTGFIVFGLVWGFLTVGGWANEDSAKLPRSSRVFLYLGYSLFSVALLNWYAAVHDVNVVTGGAVTGENGQRLLGYPLLYALLVATFAGAVVNRPIDGSEDAERIEAEAAAAEAAHAAEAEPGSPEGRVH